jgi:hypothetical protein
LNSHRASAHLRTLRDAGLVVAEDRGRKRVFRLAGPDVDLVAAGDEPRPDAAAHVGVADDRHLHRPSSFVPNVGEVPRSSAPIRSGAGIADEGSRALTGGGAPA